MILSHPTALAGSVRTLIGYEKTDFPLGSAILCRNGAPLISFAFTLWRRAIPFVVLGRSIPASILATIEITCGRSPVWAEVQPKLERARTKEVERAKSKNRMALASNLEDRYDCALHFVAGCQNMSDLRNKLRDFFAAPSGPHLQLSTGHKAKGLEWDNVFILDKSLIPSPYATQEWQKKQEQNLWYVMATRARLNLFYISSNCWKPAKTE